MVPSLHSQPFSDVSYTLQGLAMRVGGWRHRGFLSCALHLLLYGRLGRARVGFEGLVARYLAGTIVRRAARVGVSAVTADAAPPVEKAGRRPRIWPGRAGWLLWALNPTWAQPGQTASWEAGQFGAPLRHALQTPEIQAMLREVPQAGRLLGPVCRMLGIEASVVRPGFVAKVRAPARPRVRKPPVKVWERYPLPRGTLARARRHRALDRALAEVARIRREREGG